MFKVQDIALNFTSVKHPNNCTTPIRSVLGLPDAGVRRCHRRQCIQLPADSGRAVQLLEIRLPQRLTRELMGKYCIFQEIQRLFFLSVPWHCLSLLKIPSVYIVVSFVKKKVLRNTFYFIFILFRRQWMNYRCSVRLVG